MAQIQIPIPVALTELEMKLQILNKEYLKFCIIRVGLTETEILSCDNILDFLAKRKKFLLKPIHPDKAYLTNHTSEDFTARTQEFNFLYENLTQFIHIKQNPSLYDWQDDWPLFDVKNALKTSHDIYMSNINNSNDSNNTRYEEKPEETLNDTLNEEEYSETSNPDINEDFTNIHVAMETKNTAVISENTTEVITIDTDDETPHDIYDEETDIESDTEITQNSVADNNTTSENNPKSIKLNTESSKSKLDLNDKMVKTHVRHIRVKNSGKWISFADTVDLLKKYTKTKTSTYKCKSKLCFINSMGGNCNFVSRNKQNYWIHLEKYAFDIECGYCVCTFSSMTNFIKHKNSKVCTTLNF